MKTVEEARRIGKRRRRRAKGKLACLSVYRRRGIVGLYEERRDGRGEEEGLSRKWMVGIAMNSTRKVPSPLFSHSFSPQEQNLNIPQTEFLKRRLSDAESLLPRRPFV